MSGENQPQDLTSASKIAELVVEFVSIVDRPATGKTLTLKSASGQMPGRLLPFSAQKSDDELQVAYGIVYPANTVDAHGHWAEPATIRKAMERFMLNALTGNVDKQHNFAKQDAWVVECWIIRKGDPLFPDEPEGSWAAGVKVLDPDLWKSLKAGDYTGFSLAGYGELEPPPNQTQPSWLNKFQALIETVLNKSKEDPVTNEEKADIAKEVVSMLKAKGLIKSDQPPANQPQQQAQQPAPAGDLAATVATLAKSLENLPGTISDTVAKAVAKGVTEGNLSGGGAAPASSFL